MDYRALVQKLGDRTNQNSQTNELILEHRTGHPSILYNRYYGKNYHGGSLKVVPDSTDRSFEALQSALVHKKDKIWYQIEQEIQKKRNEISAAPIPLRSI